MRLLPLSRCALFREEYPVREFGVLRIPTEDLGVWSRGTHLQWYARACVGVCVCVWAVRLRAHAHAHQLT